MLTVLKKSNLFRQSNHFYCFVLQKKGWLSKSAISPSAGGMSYPTHLLHIQYFDFRSAHDSLGTIITPVLNHCEIKVWCGICWRRVVTHRSRAGQVREEAFTFVNILSKGQC